MDIRRGDIYFVDIPNFVGHEIGKNRPAVVVSMDSRNRACPVISVVYLTTKELYDTIYHPHVLVPKRGNMSTAMCEQITCVDTSRVGTYLGHISDTEMRNLERGMSYCLGILGHNVLDGDGDEQEYNDTPEEEKPAEGTAEDEKAMELVRVETERDIYKRLYEDLMARMTIRKG